MTAPAAVGLPPVVPSPIRLGSMVVTLVEPDRGHEVEFNRWYERDHFYAGCLAGPWLFAGRRFVAVRRLKDLRQPAGSDMAPDPQAGSYLALYWVLDGHHDEWSRWAVEQTNWLHEHGRMWERRSHVHSRVYRRAWSASRSPDGCPAELALDHTYAGLVVVAGDVAEGRTHADVEAWWRDVQLPAMWRQPWAPDLVVAATMLPPIGGLDAGYVAGADELERPAQARRFVQLHFLEHDPADGWDDGYARLGEAIDASGLAEHVWTAPFIPTNVGTDDFTGELW